jgi:hypothetical protein
MMYLTYFAFLLQMLIIKLQGTTNIFNKQIFKYFVKHTVLYSIKNN